MAGAISRTTAATLMMGWIAAVPDVATAQAQQPAAQPPARAGTSIGTRLSALERSIIDEYYRLKNRIAGTEAVLQGGEQPRRGALTRSVPREPQPGAALPTGARKEKLPADLQSKLPPPTPGTDRVLVGDDVVLLDPRRNIVLDVMRGATTAKP